MINDENSQKLEEIFRSVLDLGLYDSVEEADRNSISKWDSLAQMSLIASIENEFSIEIDLSDYETFVSYQSILKILNKHGL